MSRTVRAAILCIGCALTLGAGTAVSKGLQEEDVNRMIEGAMSAGTFADAEAQLQNAVHMLEGKGSSLGEVVRSFLEADGGRARGRIYAKFWRREPDRTELRAKAEKTLLKVLDKYQLLQKHCEDEAEDMEVRLGDSVERNESYRRICGYISRANYAIAWTEYSLGVVAGSDSERGKHLKRAIEKFVSFTADGYRRHPIILDCFFGQALALYELKRYHEVTHLLKEATPMNTPPNTFKLMLYLSLRAHQGISSYLKVETLGKSYFDELPAGHRLDTVELEMALIRARSLAYLIQSQDTAKYQEAFRGRLEEVSQLILPYGEPWRSKLSDIMANGALGGAFLALSKARKYFQAKRFKQVIVEARRGLESARSETDPTILADLRYAETAAYWNLQAWGEAHTAALEFLKNHMNDKRAGEVCSLAFRAGLKAMSSKPPLKPERFLEFLSFAESNFPKHPEAKKVPWYRAKLLIQSGRFREAEKVLETVGVDSPIHPYALYGLALASYKQAEAKPAMEGQLARTADAVSLFVQRVLSGLSEEERWLAKGMAEISVATARRWLDLPKPNPRGVLQFLQSAEPLATVNEKTSGQLAALTIEARVVGGDIDAVDELLNKVKRRDVINEELADSLITIAEILEKQYNRLIDDSKSDAGRGVAQKLLGVYSLLARYVATNAKAGSRQQVSIHRRLAHTCLRLGMYRDAIKQYEWVLKKIPRQGAGDVIRSLAVAYEKTGQYDSSIKMWRILSKGPKKKSGDWFEAHYCLIRSYVKAGQRLRALRLLQFFRLQHSQSEPPEWREKFDTLEKDLSKRKNEESTVELRGSL